MKTLSCLALLALAGLMGACGADSGGGPMGTADPFVGTWHPAPADLAGASEEEQRATIAEGLRFVVRADGTYTAVVPRGADASGPTFEEVAGTWTKSGDGYDTLESGADKPNVHMTVKGDKLSFTPPGAPPELVFTLIRK